MPEILSHALIQADINRTAQHWNIHDIRQQKRTHDPSGKPEILYFVPELYCLFSTTEQELTEKTFDLQRTLS